MNFSSDSAMMLDIAKEHCPLFRIFVSLQKKRSVASEPPPPLQPKCAFDLYVRCARVPFFSFLLIAVPSYYGDLFSWLKSTRFRASMYASVGKHTIVFLLDCLHTKKKKSRHTGKSRPLAPQPFFFDVSKWTHVIWDSDYSFIGLEDA